MKITGSFLVSLYFNDTDVPVLLVGRKNKGDAVEIVNAFQGEEAVSIYKMLTTVKGGD